MRVSAICQRYMREITGNDSIAMGITVQLLTECPDGSVPRWETSRKAQNRSTCRNGVIPKRLCGIDIPDYGGFYYITALIAGKVSVQEVLAAQTGCFIHSSSP
jgi:hypothetical protein